MKNIKAIILMLLTSVICFTSFTVYAETNTLKAGILDDYSFDGNSINEYAEDSMNTILDTTASTNFIANEINFDDTTFNKGISDLQSGNIDFYVWFLRVMPFWRMLTIHHHLSQQAF